MADRIPVIAGEVVRRIGARLPDLTPDMTTMFIDIISEFRHDQAVQRLMVASTASNLGAVVDMLMLGISLEDIAVPPAAAEYARRFAQHDLSLEACYHRVRKAEELLGRPVTDGRRSKSRCSPGINSRQQPRSRYLRPTNERVDQPARPDV